MIYLSHKAERDLFAEMPYTRLNDAGKRVEVTRRGSVYDALGRPTSRTQTYPQQKFARGIPSTITDALEAPDGWQVDWTKAQLLLRRGEAE